MAIIIPEKKLKNGLIIKNPYINICDLSCEKTDTYIVVRYYLNRDSRINNEQSLETEFYNFKSNLSSNLNIFAQSYEFLKTLTGFENSIDIIE